MDRTTDNPEGVFAYMDDSCVGYPDRQTHHLHLEAFSNALASNGLAINLQNVFLQCMPSSEIFGHTISDTGSAPTAGHAAKIELCPPPPHQTTAMFSWHGELLPPFVFCPIAHRCCAL